MAEEKSRLERLMAMGNLGVHTADEKGYPLSIIAGGYVIASTDDTTTISCRKDNAVVSFPREMVDLIISMLGSHSLSNEDDDYDDEDFTDQEAEERLP